MIELNYFEMQLDYIILQSRMQIALTVLTLLDLASSTHSIPLSNVGGHVNKVRDALEHIQNVRSALRRSLDTREGESIGTKIATIFLNE